VGGALKSALAGLASSPPSPCEEEAEFIWELTLHEWDPRRALELNLSSGVSSFDGGGSPGSPGGGGDGARGGTGDRGGKEKPLMGASLAMAAEATGSDWSKAWAPIPADVFQVRGPSYLADKVKQPSGRSMFECVGGDCVISDGPMRHVAARVQLPSTAAALPKTPIGSTVPALFIMNVQIPIQPRAMFGARKLPPTVNAVFYMRLNPEVQDWCALLDAADQGGDAAARFAADHPALSAEDVPGPVRLLHRWCRDAVNDDVLRGALKLMGFGRNFGEVGAPSFVQSYNGKPVLLAGGGLTAGSRLGFGQIYRGANYLEVDIDVAAHFTYLSQRGICWALGLLDKLNIDIAFVIEGRCEEDLPECVLGCVSISKMAALSTIDEAAMFGAAFSSLERDAHEQAKGGETGTASASAAPDPVVEEAQQQQQQGDGGGGSGVSGGAADTSGDGSNRDRTGSSSSVGSGTEAVSS
jgi:hypothetical protein